MRIVAKEVEEKFSNSFAIFFSPLLFLQTIIFPRLECEEEEEILLINNSPTKVINLESTSMFSFKFFSAAEANKFLRLFFASSFAKNQKKNQKKMNLEIDHLRKKDDRAISNKFSIFTQPRMKR
jgi:hypothetical protein